MQRDAGNISEAQINEYYQQHAPDFKTITFERIFVPKQKQIDAAPGKDSADLQAKRTGSEAAMKDEADKLRARAAAGEDFLKLQQEANDFAGSKMKASNVKMENMRKTSIPTTDASIFDLKKGEVSPVFSDPTGYRIYKVEEVQDAPLASVHEEIQRTLQGQNMKSEFESVQNSAKATLDQTYFATPAPPSLRRPDEAPAPAPKAPSSPGKP
jgi:parvulin-like peptidyl-prolyl isomerase